jgi:phage terminase Nu1 subunit (DNA packaging protein)
MTPPNGKTPVILELKHLRKMKFYLSQYLDLLCDQAKEAKEGEKVKEINDLAFLDLVIHTILETHCDDNA